MSTFTNGTKSRFVVALASRHAADELDQLLQDLEGLTSGAVQADGSVPFTADQSMGGNKLTSLAEPAADTDAATKGYVDSQSGGSSDVFEGPTLSGTFNHSVYVDGDIALSGTTIINGNLVVTGTLSSPDGYGLTTAGDLRVASFNFTTTADDAVQENVLIGGTFIAPNNSEFRVNTGQAPTLSVNGKMIGKSWDGTTFNGSGKAGAAGLTITVLGEITGISFNLDGGDATASGNAGDGGTLQAYGGGLLDLSANGGNSSVSGRAPGNGGSLYAYSQGLTYNYSGYALSGGNANVSGQNGGNGGYIICSSITGTPTDDLVVMNGGNSIDGVGGNGGVFEFYGEWNAGVVSLNGGSGATGGNGGSTAGSSAWGGCVNATSFYANGGAGSSQGGTGGNASFHGSCVFEYELFAKGGDGGTTGGNGGTIFMAGTLTIPNAGEAGALGGGGGTSVAGGAPGGSAGTVTLGATLRASSLAVANSAAATSLGSVVKKMEIFDKNGASLGFVPIYDDIT